MIKQRFLLDPAAHLFLDLTAPNRWSDVRLTVGGISLGPPLSRRELRDGQTYTLSDGSELAIQLKTPFIRPALRIEHDGRVVPGCDLSKEALTKYAGHWLIGLGVLNALIGFAPPRSLDQPSTRNAFFLVGAFWVTAGFLSRKGSFPALVLGSAVFFLGVVRGLSTSEWSTIFVQIMILAPMVRALHAHYLDRTTGVPKVRSANVARVKATPVIQPPTEFAETIAPESRAGVLRAEGEASVPAPRSGPAARPATPASVATSGPAWSDGHPTPEGLKFGPYVVFSTLGSGGMATVYRARQTSVGRDVALKVITGQHEADSDFNERFRREAETMARLSHPHILKVFDFGDEGGRPYLAMEFMGGGTLRSRIGGTRLPTAQVLKWAEQIGLALHSAHSQGVVHRDVKPENVLLDQNGNAFLADFGLARLSDAKGSLTQAGMQMGSPSYMPPEQWHGADVTPPADLYSFGAMLFELLAGVPPFRASSLPALMAQHIQRPVPSVRSLRPSLPPAVDAFFSKALNKSPALRFQDAAGMVDAIRGALRAGPVAGMARSSGRPAVQARSAPDWSDVGPGWRRAFAAVAAVALLGVWWFWPFPVSSPQVRRVTQSARPSQSARPAAARPKPTPLPLVPSTLAGGITPLLDNLTHIAFSRKLNRLVYASKARPQFLYILDPETGRSVGVHLPAEARNLNVSHDGLFALVSHEFSVTSIALSKPEASLTIPVQDMGSVALVGGWVYVFPFWSDYVKRVNLQTREVMIGDFGMRGGGRISVHPQGERLYYAEVNDVHRIDLRASDFVLGDQFLRHKTLGDRDLRPCGGLWISDRGNVAVDPCGGTFALSGPPKKDLDRMGGVPNLPQGRNAAIVAFDLSEAAGRAVVVPNPIPFDRPSDKLLTYEFPGYRPIDQDVLPRFSSDTGPVAASGRFAVVGGGGKRLYVVLSAPGHNDALYAGPLK